MQKYKNVGAVIDCPQTTDSAHTKNPTDAKNAPESFKLSGAEFYISELLNINLNCEMLDLCISCTACSLEFGNHIAVASCYIGKLIAKDLLV